MTSADDLMTDLGDGLRRRVAERRRAEEQLAAFVFREGAGGDPRAPQEADLRYFVARTLAVVGEPGTLDLLERMSRGPETMTALAGEHTAGLAGGLATADRIGALGAAGLAVRDLETARVGLTALGSAVLAFAQEWERRAAEPDPGPVGAPVPAAEAAPPAGRRSR